MKCPNCKEKNGSKERYCKKCGFDLRRKRITKKIVLSLGLFGIFICADIFCIIQLWIQNNYLTSENSVTYNDEDVVYRSQKENIAYDSEKNMRYYNNLLTVYLTKEFSVWEATSLARKVDGKVVGYIKNDIYLLQIEVESTDLKTLEEKADILTDAKNVFAADFDFPVEVENDTLEEIDENPWGIDENDKVANDNDWWAKAIDTYTAWDVINPESKVTVGVVDSGFLTGHEEFKKKNGESKITFLDDYSDNSVHWHGTHVTGLIGAQNNIVGIRGVADEADLLCVDWTPVTNDEEDEDYLDLTSTVDYIRILRKMIIENNVKVINNSWGLAIETQDKKPWEEYPEINENNDDTELYEQYLNITRAISEETTENMLDIMSYFLLMGQDDFLIVQSAGNGYNNGDIEYNGNVGRGYDVNQTGYFRAINEEKYNEFFQSLSEDTQKLLEEKGIDYQSIKEHLLIVGATQKEKDENGNYKMCYFSNYGDNIDICAPGQDILSCTDFDSDGGAVSREEEKQYYYATDSDDKNTCYTKSSGTSMATPMAAGAAAYLKSIDASLKPEEIKKYLIDTANSAIGVTDEDAGKIYPMLDFGAAVEKVIRDKKIISAEEAYQRMIDRYKTLCNVSEFDWFDRYDEYLAKYPNVNPYVMFNYHMDDHTYYYDGSVGYDYPYEIVYQLYDVDKNGTPELLIAQSFKGEMGEKYKLCDMYAFDGVKAVKLFPEQTFLGDVEQFLVDAYEGADIGQLYIYDEPGLVGVVSGDASYYKFSADGYSLESYRTHEQFWGQHEIVSTFTDEDWTVIGEDVVFTAPDLDDIYQEYGNDFGKAMVRVLPNDNRYYYYLAEKYFGKNYSTGNNQEYGWENLIWDNEDMEISLENLGDDIGYWFRTIKYKTDSYKFLDVCIGDRYKDAVRTIQHYAKEMGFEFNYGDDTGNPNESQYYMEFKEGRSYCVTGCMVTFEMDSYDRITGMVIQFD